MARTTRYSQEVRERAVRMVFEHRGEYDSEWEAIGSIAEKIGCTAETLRKWVRQTQVDTGRRGGVTSDERVRMKELERDLGEARKRRKLAVKEEEAARQKRKLENEMKAVVYQTITKTHKLKTMNKKQLRQIKKTRMSKHGVVELVGAYEK